MTNNAKYNPKSKALFNRCERCDTVLPEKNYFKKCGWCIRELRKKKEDMKLECTCPKECKNGVGGIVHLIPRDCVERCEDRITLP